MEVYSVYKTTNKVTQQYYIGYHKSEDPNDEYLGSGARMLQAIKEYGEVVFRKEVLFVFDNAKEAFAKEKELVALYRNIDPLCININPGGKGGWAKGHHKSEETKAKMRKPKSEETKAKMRKPKSEEAKKNMKGRIYTEETLAKQSKAAKIRVENRKKKGYAVSDETRKKISINSQKMWGKLKSNQELLNTFKEKIKNTQMNKSLEEKDQFRERIRQTLKNTPLEVRQEWNRKRLERKFKGAEIPTLSFSYRQWEILMCNETSIPPGQGKAKPFNILVALGYLVKEGKTFHLTDLGRETFEKYSAWWEIYKN